jgi:competence protein ComFC
MWGYFSKIVETLFPPSCFSCHTQGTVLCDACLRTFAKVVDTPATYITSIYSFRDPIIKRVIHSIKYYHRRDLIEPLTRELQKVITQQFISNDWTLVPIPMPRLRRYMRGYNQAEVIAKTLSEKCNIPFKKSILEREHSVKRQVETMSRALRLKNQHNSFKVISNVEGCNIILVDDVTTTGATLSEARRILLKFGAKSVYAVTIAH